MDLRLNDQVAVVTGASKGIRLAITRALAKEGAFAVAGARTVDGLQGIERVTALAVGLVAPDGPARLVERALSAKGRVDVLVNKWAPSGCGYKGSWEPATTRTPRRAPSAAGSRSSSASGDHAQPQCRPRGQSTQFRRISTSPLGPTSSMEARQPEVR